MTFDDVVARGGASARRRASHAGVTSATLDERTGAQAFLKAENLQRMGAFKFRGAYNRLAQLDERERARRRGRVLERQPRAGRGAGGAAARHPGDDRDADDAPLAKLAATRGYGAEVVLYDRKTMNRAEIAQRVGDERGATLVPPYDDPMIIAGRARPRSS